MKNKKIFELYLPYTPYSFHPLTGSLDEKSNPKILVHIFREFLFALAKVKIWANERWTNCGNKRSREKVVVLNLTNGSHFLIVYFSRKRFSGRIEEKKYNNGRFFRKFTMSELKYVTPKSSNPRYYSLPFALKRDEYGGLLSGVSPPLLPIFDDARLRPMNSSKNLRTNSIHYLSVEIN